MKKLFFAIAMFISFASMSQNAPLPQLGDGYVVINVAANAQELVKEYGECPRFNQVVSFYIEKGYKTCPNGSGRELRQRYVQPTGEYLMVVENDSVMIVANTKCQQRGSYVEAVNDDRFSGHCYGSSSLQTLIVMKE